MPQIIQGTWYSWEHGQSTQSNIDYDSMSQYGKCDSFSRDGADYAFVFKSPTQNSYRCVKIYPRTFNILEKIEGPRVILDADDEPTVERICDGIRDDQSIITLFNVDYIPLNCRSSLQGAWQFAYEVS